MSPPSVMRAVVLTGHGGPEMLEYRTDVPVPRPAGDEVLIEVSACGMNNTDINTRVGWYSPSVTGSTEATTAAAGHTPGRANGSWSGGIAFPRIQGADPVGRVVEVGADADPAVFGRRVVVDGWVRDPSGDRSRNRYLGSELDGGFAEYVAVPAVNAHPIETDLTDVELATFPCSYATAEHMLHRAGVAGDQWVLVTGASGGVGGALVQLALRRGARVVALTTEAKRTQVADLGAQVVLDRAGDDLVGQVEDHTGGGVDVVADIVGGPAFSALLGMLRPGGHYVTSGAIGGPVVELDLRTLYLRDLTMHGATVLPPEVFSDLVRYIERGEIRPLVAGTWPLERLAEAQEAFARKQHVGAMVVEVAR